jgi:tetratricopeptide (TPR) repeat protein
LLFSVLIAITFTAASRAENTPDAFEAANRLYFGGKYSEAATTYAILEQSGQRSAALYFNWGNALFKSSQLGRAIVEYRQAQALAPRDPDIRANLQFARTQRQGPTLSPSKSQQWIRKLSVNEWAILAAVALWLFFGLLTLTQFRPELRRSAKGSLIALALIALVLSGCTGLAVSATKSEQQAVVIVPDADVRNGPLDEAQTAFAVHDGAELGVIDRKDDWFQVEADSGRTGWIKKDQLILVQ